MEQLSEVSALRVADEGFLVASTIERCPKTMMVRELFTNAIEAAMQASPTDQIVEIGTCAVGGARKLTIWNTGPGMSGVDLHRICDLASSIGKEKGLDNNFGMGAKVASLPSNKFGMRYRSCKEGVVSEVLLGQREGVYGRIVRPDPTSGQRETIFDVTNTYAVGLSPSRDWTEVVLFGNRADQDTVSDPYNGDPNVTGQWLADYLYHRFFRLPPQVQVRFKTGTHKLGDGTRTFKTIPDRAFPIGKSETVTVERGIKIHYFYDPPLAGTSHNKSVSGAITTDVSVCSVVYRNEMFDVRTKRQWSFDAPIFGITFGPRHISIHIELPDNSNVRPDAYRQFLRYRDGEQQQVECVDFAPLVHAHRPDWLIEIINSFAPADSSSTDKIRDELQKLLNSLRVRSLTPRVGKTGDLSVGSGFGGGGVPASGSASTRNGSTAAIRPSSDILAVPDGAKRATMALNSDRAPEIKMLLTKEQADEKGIKGKSARYVKETGELFVNMTYPAVADMAALLENEYAATADVENMRKMARLLAERTIIIRVGRAVIFAIAKKLNQEWSLDDMDRAQSPESLSLAADDFSDALQNCRRAMGKALRTARQEIDQLETV
jgi:hypothetical protein